MIARCFASRHVLRLAVDGKTPPRSTQQVLARASLGKESSANAKAAPTSKADIQVASQEQVSTIEEFTPPKFAWSIGNIAMSAPSGIDPPSENNARRSPSTRMSALPWPLQAKLEIGAVDDPLEHEADRVAEQVMRMPEPASPAVASTWHAPSDGASGVPTQSTSHLALWRKCACGGSCDKCKAEQADDEHGKVQRKPASGQISPVGVAHPTSTTTAPPLVHEVLRSPGQPLSAAALAFFEPRFGRDFSQVRVHAGAKADESARELNALAYTIGSNVVLAGQSAALPLSQRHQLLAHELAHVVQQTSVPKRIQRQPKATNPTKKEQTSIVKIVAYEDSTNPGVATLSTGETTPVTITSNCFLPGVYSLKRIKESRHYQVQTVHKQLAGAKKPTCEGFLWVKPKEYTWAESVTVIIIPEFTRKFFTAQQGEKGTGTDTEILEAEEILTRFGVNEDELFLEQERRKDDEENDRVREPGDATDWALSFVGKQQRQQEAAMTQRESLNSAKARLALIPPNHANLATTYFTDKSYNGTLWYAYKYQERLGRDEYIDGTDFSDRKDLFATLNQFEAALEQELRSLTEATLTATEVAILKVMEAYVGRRTHGVGYGYLERELNKAKENPEIDALRKAIRNEEENPQIDHTSQIAHDYSKKEHEKRLDALNEKLTNSVGKNSNLKVAGVKGFDAKELLDPSPSHAQFLLDQTLADGRRTIARARKQLHEDSNFVYGADKIIAAEKRMIGVEPGSGTSLDQIIDAIVRAKLSERSFWEDLWALVDFLINIIPIPPPAGVILRAIAAGIDIGRELDENAKKSLSYDAGMSSEKPSSGALAATILFTAAGTAFDVGSAGLLGGESKGVSLSLEETGAASAAGHGAQQEGAVAEDALEREAAEPAQAEKQLGEAGAEGSKESIANPEKYLEEHPPGKVEGSQPGQRHAHAGDHDVVEVMEEGHIHCELHSTPPHILVDCPEGMGDLDMGEHEDRSDVEPRTDRQAGVGPGEGHHIATVYGNFGRRNRAVFRRAGKSMDNEINMIENFMEHRELRGWYKKAGNKYTYVMKGHHDEYHEWVTNLLEAHIPKGITEHEAADRLETVLNYLSAVIEDHPDVLQYGTDVFAGRGGPPPFAP
jgi:hypothetical protein